MISVKRQEQKLYKRRNADFESGLEYLLQKRTDDPYKDFLFWCKRLPSTRYKPQAPLCKKTNEEALSIIQIAPLALTERENFHVSLIK
jgi:hypothetical protein